jgi:TusA-related sulfurtransferase
MLYRFIFHNDYSMLKGLKFSMHKMPLSELKKQLKTYKAEELISIIVDCYKSSDDVKKYIHVMLDPESAENQLFDEAKIKISRQFYPERGDPKLKLAEAKKAISEFNKLCSNPVRTLDLMIYYVEVGVEFTNDYGDIHEPFYNSMESMYQNVLNKIRTEKDQGLYNLYRDRLKAIVENTDGIGWGFHDQLDEMFFEIAQEFGEDVE